MKRHILVSVVVLAIATVAGSSAQQTQGNNSKGAAMRALNGKILQHLDQAGKLADPTSERTVAAPDFAQREAALSALIEEDPAEALRTAFTPDLLETLRDNFPDSAGQLERHGTWTGTLESLVADDLNGKKAKTVHRLKTAEGVLKVYSDAPFPPIPSGATVTVKGVASGGAVAAADGVAADQTGGPVGMACGQTGAQNVATILVNLPSFTLPSAVTASYMKSVLYGNAAGGPQSTPDWSVDDFWQQASDGQTNAPIAGGIVVGPYTLANNFNTDPTIGGPGCDYMGLWQAAINAADADVNFQNYNRVVVVFPYQNTCSWSGLSSIGCWTNSSTGDGSFTSSASWLRADQLTSRTTGVQLTAHELGHGLGLHHASTREYSGPPRETLGAVNTQGTLNEYGDVFSTMGSWNFGFYAAPHMQEILGWYGASNYQLVNTSGQYQIEAAETRNATSQVKALKVVRDQASNSYVWLEYRTNTGNYDSQLGSQVWSGALIHYEDGSTSTHSHLLDGTAGTTAWTDPALAVGQTWTDPYTGLSITANSIVGTKLNVTVSYGAAQCLQANPTVTLSPTTVSVNGGQSTIFSVSVKNNDSTICPASTFGLTSSQGTGFTGTLSPSSLSIAAGGTGTATLTEKAGTTLGTFSASVTATDTAYTSYSATGSASVTVTNTCMRSNPTVTLTPNPVGVVPSGSITFTVSVKNNDSPACSSSTFSLAAVHPTGFSGTFSKTSLSSVAAGGTASTTLTEKAGTAAGSFTLTVKATNSGATAYVGSGTAAITVAACTLANPTVTLTPTSASVNTSGSYAFTVNVKNNSSFTCANGAFTMSSTQASGLTGTYSPTSVTIASGANANVTLTEKAATTTGTLSFTATATTSSTYKASATGSVTVVAIKNTITSDKTTYTRPGSIVLTTTVAGATGVSGLATTFTLKKANGTSVTGTGTTNAQGVATWTYSLTASDPAGSYTASSSAKVNTSLSYASNTLTLTVQ